MRILIVLIGLTAIVFGVLQMREGAKELSGSGMPTEKEAQQRVQADLSAMASFESAERGIALEHPKSWEKATPAEGPLFLAVKTLQGAVNCNVAAQDVAAGTQLAEFVAANADATREALVAQDPAAREVGRKELTVGGEPALRITYAYSMKDPVTAIEVDQTWVVHASRAYAITMTAPGALIPAYSKVEDRILGSVRFL